MIKVGVLGSTKGTDLQAIINSIDKKELNAENYGSDTIKH